jgi:hypothetical protein
LHIVSVETKIEHGECHQNGDQKCPNTADVPEHDAIKSNRVVL